MKEKYISDDEYKEDEHGPYIETPLDRETLRADHLQIKLNIEKSYSESVERELLMYKRSVHGLHSDIKCLHDKLDAANVHNKELRTKIYLDIISPESKSDLKDKL